MLAVYAIVVKEKVDILLNRVELKVGTSSNKLNVEFTFTGPPIFTVENVEVVFKSNVPNPSLSILVDRPFCLKAELYVIPAGLDTKFIIPVALLTPTLNVCPAV
jgi:hypothetical protein